MTKIFPEALKIYRDMLWTGPKCFWNREASLPKDFHLRYVQLPISRNNPSPIHSNAS